MAFDPYHKWLAIPKEHRPPTYYQLLAVAPDETDLEVIEEAAIRQSTHLRAYQVGPHADDCTRLLNEISAARSTLLHPAKRRAYDAKLGINQAVTAAAHTAVTSAPPRPQFELQDDEPGAVVARSSRSQPLDIRRKPSALLYWVIGGGVATLLLVLLVVVLLLFAPAPVRPPAPVVVKKPEPPEVNRLAPPPEENVPAPNPKPRLPRANPPQVNPPQANPPLGAGNAPVRIQLPPVPPPLPGRQPDGPGLVPVESESIFHVHFVPGQRKALFTSNNSQPRKFGYCLWDLDAKAVQHWFATDKGNVQSHANCVAVSADGTWALGGESNQLRRLDLVTGEDIVLPWPGVTVQKISIAPDGKQALLHAHFHGQNVSKVVLVDVAKPHNKLELATDNSLHILGWTDEGRSAVIRHRNEIHLFERSEGRRTANFSVRVYPAMACMSQDGNRLVSWTPYMLGAFDPVRREELFQTTLDKANSEAPPMVSADGRWIAVAQRNRLTRLDGNTGIKERTWQASRHTIRTAALSSDGALALTWSYQDRALRFWDLNQPVTPFPAAPANLGSSRRIDTTSYVQLLPMEGEECLRLENNELTVCRLPTLEHVRPVAKGSLPYQLPAGAFQPPWVLLSSSNKIAKVNVTNGAVEHLPIADRNMRTAALSRTGKYLAVAVDRSLKLWDGAGQKLLGQRDDVEFVNGLVFFKNEERCLAASSNGLHLLELPTLATIKIWSNYAANVALSPDDRLAAFGAFNGIFVLDLATEQFVSVFHNRTNTNTPTLAFLRGGTHLACADGEAICIYNIREQKETSYFPYETGFVQQLDVAGDGRTIITRRDGIHIWEVSKELLP